MIDEPDRELEQWVVDVAGPCEVSLKAPAADAPAGVGLYLLRLAGLPPARGNGRPPLQVRLDYLVTAPDPDPVAGHARLAQLLFAAMQRDDADITFPDWELWWAMGATPQPAFLVSLRLRRPLDQPPVKSVVHPLVLRGASLRALDGVVLGPDDVPIADAMVEMTALRRATRSDRRGRFHFDAVPDHGGTEALQVLAKARAFPFTVDLSTSEPVSLRLDLAKD